MPLTVHFLNVGRGDCTIIEFPSGRIGMVDVSNIQDLDSDTEREYREIAARRVGPLPVSLIHPLGDVLVRQIRQEQLAASLIKEAKERLTNPLDYYLLNFTDPVTGLPKPIFRLLITHADMDHMSGLATLAKQIPILNVWHTGQHDYNLARTTDAEWAACPYDEKDWETYKRLRVSDTGPKSIFNLRDATGDFWTQDGLEILAPTEPLIRLAVEREEANISSMVLGLSYKGKTILLGGDATADETWPDIVGRNYNLYSVWVLKASHHGRRTGYYGPAVKAMSPWLAITSVTESEHDATENYRRYSQATVSLRDTGSFWIRIGDDGQITSSPHIWPHAKLKKAD